ncbi:MAG: phosphogluconate dehydrogenase C-terminal domain-containing protein [Mangrovibacterium sp.]|nr:phosphogluconate dehydrogenase C-terminal domain-containing protein [Mangrovibacterium sp.]
MQKVVLVGAGGKMGCRLTCNLKSSAYQMQYVEISPAGTERLKELGVSVSESSRVVPQADVVILAVPDVALGKVSEMIIPQMRTGAVVVFLDPAVAMAGKLYRRDDVAYFISHPAHPSVFNWEETPEAQKDFFGGTLARQAIVCTLLQGDEAVYTIGEKLASTMYAPVSQAFRITVEQMALLEPALVETLSSTCLVIVKEGLDEVIRRGVPADAARAFLLGHLNIQLAVIFGEIPGAVFSDAANKAIERGRSILFRDDWKKIFEPDNVLEQVNDIT